MVSEELIESWTKAIGKEKVEYALRETERQVKENPELGEDVVFGALCAMQRSMPLVMEKWKEQSEEKERK